MGRFKRGAIILNKWATDRNPTRIFIYLGNGSGIDFDEKGKIHKVQYNYNMMEKDIEHFVQIGQMDIDSVIKENMEKNILIKL